MKHADPQTLDQLDPLLVQIRSLNALVERKRGVFYHKGRAFLHFHVDNGAVYADLRGSAEADFQRHRVVSAEEQAALLSAARARL